MILFVINSCILTQIKLGSDLKRLCFIYLHDKSMINEQSCIYHRPKPSRPGSDVEAR